MNEILSQIIADLLVKSKGGEELSSKVLRLRGEIKKVIESENAIFGKFCGLLESLREIIPEEKQRYKAAIKALSTTSQLSRQEIVKAVNNQLEELKILEKGLLSSLPGWRDELKAMEAKAKEMRDEISKLREQIAALESEEQGILNGMTTREKEVELVETAMRELLTDIGAEITSFKNKIEEFTDGSATVQPIPQRGSIASDTPSEKKGGDEQKSEVPESSEPQDTEWQKKCPMCGGRINFYASEERWMCYACAYEELTKDQVQGKSEENSEHTNAPKPAQVSEPISDPSQLLGVPLVPLSSNEFQESKKKSSPSNSQPSTKTKTCPVCRKKMNWYQREKAWRCRFCNYERRI